MKLKVSSLDLRPETEASLPTKRRWRPLDWLHWMRQHPHVVALFGYVLLTLAITFPLILHLQDSIVGPVMYGDSMWYTWYSYAFRQAVLAGHDPSTTHLLYALLPQIQLF